MKLLIPRLLPLELKKPRLLAPNSIALKLVLKYATIAITSIVSLGLTSCKTSSDSSSTSMAEELESNNEKGIPKLPSYPQLPTTRTIADKREAELVANEVADKIKLSQAKLAAKRRDVCPKLISNKVGTNVLTRAEEVLSSDYCDYYIYPNVGERIRAKSNSDVINAVLVSPTLFDFANGSYVVKQGGKHTIRLSYVGIKFRDKPINYDMTVTIQ